jgi:hypothetical protein
VNIISSGANHSIVVGKSITTNETVVYGWGGNMNGFNTLLTLLSGTCRVVSVGAQNPYGQMGRSLPTSQYTPRYVPLDSCDCMALDRPVRAGFPGRQFSLLMPQDSTAFLPQTTDNCSSVDEFSFGTWGLGESGCLAVRMML